MKYYTNSHLSKETADLLIPKLRQKPECNYLDKVQLLLKKQDSVAFCGKTMRSVHANGSNTHKISLYYVLKIRHKTLSQILKCNVAGYFSKKDYQYYYEDFDWITSQKKYSEWQIRKIIAPKKML